MYSKCVLLFIVLYAYLITNFKDAPLFMWHLKTICTWYFDDTLSHTHISFRWRTIIFYKPLQFTKVKPKHSVFQYIVLYTRKCNILSNFKCNSLLEEEVVVVDSNADAMDVMLLLVVCLDGFVRWLVDAWLSFLVCVCCIVVICYKFVLVFFLK